jgi:hypothetical protein
MTVPRHLEAAVDKLKEASLGIDRAREGPLTSENQKAWLEALTEYCQALGDIQTYNSESIHEKLHELAGRMGLKQFPSS